MLQDNLFSGTVPAWLGSASQLSSLDLRDNQLAGEVPSELANLDMLSTFKLSGNGVSFRR